jgi:nicotinamide mononucleotide adenylyltransferase
MMMPLTPAVTSTSPSSIFVFSEMDEQKAEHAGIREQEAEDAIRLSETLSPSTTFTMLAPEQVSQGSQRGW